MKWLAGFMLALSFSLVAAPAAQAETRTLKLYFIHTKEKAEITFKRNGRYDQDGLKKINRFLRDWRRNEPTRMDPRLLDLVWETYRASGAKDYIHVVSAYRSPATNSMLRSRSKGVAEKSQHMLGKAMDFYIPGVPLKKLRDTGLRMQIGGVGYYPRSGSPFVHFDVGSVRHWPRMSRKELVSVFPSGKTLHVPSDGKPLPGYETALASYESRKKSGTTALALASPGGSSRSGGLLSALFGGGADEEEDIGEEAATAAPARKPAARARTAPSEAAAPAAEQPPAGAAPLIDETPVTIMAALPARSIPLPAFAPRPKADVGPAASPVEAPFGLAAARPEEGVGAEIVAEERFAANVPLPVWRPSAAAAAKSGPDGQESVESMLMAMGQGPVKAPQSITLGAPQPASRPVAAGKTDRNVYAVAGLPVKSAVLAAEMQENEARLAMLSTGATEAATVLSDIGSKLAVGVGARTTPKTARARPRDTRPDPKPMVLAAQPDAVRWALSSDSFVAGDAEAPAEAPPVAHSLLRQAPSEVYTAGFQQTAVVAEASRFSGRAVKFMPIARFATN